nr:probable potassium transporter 13 [Populus alba]
MDQESGATQDSRQFFAFHLFLKRVKEIVSGYGVLVVKFYKTTLLLAYQTFGVVYGDLCTSPIYVYKSSFSGELQIYERNHEIFGVLSIVFWTLTIIPLCKYMIIVLGANDNGEGGTFALYSLLCRHSRMGLLNSSHLEHEFVTCYDSNVSTKETRASLVIKEFFNKHRSSRVVLLLVVLLGTSMVIGDGIPTPAMSVLSAVYGIQIKDPDLHENYTVAIACVILVGVFALQHCGTHRIGFLFSPILIAWLLCISGVGIYNISHWNPDVVKALSPYYIYNFFKKTGKAGWCSLGGIVLCATGAEAMFADLGHFSELSVRIAFTGLVYPCLVLAYMGEAAYLSRNRGDLQSSFYKAVPVFIIATLATVVGSQAIISAIFSIISQCRALNCFPRVKIVHTSNNIHGQIYIPEVNWVLMILCLAVVAGFTEAYGLCYLTLLSCVAFLFVFICIYIANEIFNVDIVSAGLAVITVMLVTTLLMFLIISTVWKKHVFLAFLFVVIFGFVELSYFDAGLAKLHKGGWFPLVVSAVVSSLMSIWHYGTLKKQAYKVSLDCLLRLGPCMGIATVPGVCLVYYLCCPANVGTFCPQLSCIPSDSYLCNHSVSVFDCSKSSGQ